MEVYFDNASTSPLRKEVIDVMAQVMNTTYGNPSSTHTFGRSAKSYLETARKSIAKMLNADPQEIIFTSGGTESDNMILQCAVKDLGVRTLISSPIEHHAILHAMESFSSDQINKKFVQLHPDGSVDLNHLESLLTETSDKKLVSLMHVNNEIGNILDLDAVGKLCHKHDAYFHSDAVQGIGHYTFNLETLPIDFLSAAAHKFHGPKGVGFSFVRRNSGLKPLIHGGGQERGLRAGTESVHNIVGMQKALELSYQNLDREKEHIFKLKHYFLKELKSIFPTLKTNGLSGGENGCTYNLINVALPVTADKAMLLDFHLDLKGIACSKGSACQSGSSSGSHVLNAIQTDEVKALPSLRFSFSIFNSKEEVDYVIGVLKEFSK